MAESVQFNCIYIIQSLPDDETQTGSKLYQDVKILSYRFEHLQVELLDVSSKNELHQALYDLNEAVLDNGVVPYLHLEIHGSKQGLVLKNGDRISWGSLRPVLTAINYNVENSLFVSLATCFGAYLFTAVDILERIPFLGFVGPASEISTGDVEKDWGAYFDVLLSTRDFNEAIDSLNESNRSVPYAFFTAEQIFDLYTRDYLKNAATRQGRRAKLLSMRKTAYQAFPNLKKQYTREQLDTYLKYYISNQKKLVAEIKDYFMMLTDEFPFPR